jgi:hypothetical protein
MRREAGRWGVSDFLWGWGGEGGRRTDAETEEAEEGYGVGGEAPAEFAGAGLLLWGVHGGQWVCLGWKYWGLVCGWETDTSLFLGLEVVGLRRLARLGSSKSSYLGFLLAASTRK